MCVAVPFNRNVAVPKIKLINQSSNAALLSAGTGVGYIW